MPSSLLPSIGKLVFADDITLWSSGSTPIVAWVRAKPFVNSVISWISKWRLVLNVSKTKSLFFTRRRTWPKSEFPIVSILKTPVESVKEIKFLGVVFDSTCSWKSHIRYLSSSSQLRVLGLKRIMSQRIHSRIGILLYKVLIRPILLYAAPILLTASETQWDALKRLDNHALRAAQRIFTLDISINALYSGTGLQKLRASYESASKSFLLRLSINNSASVLSKLSGHHLRPYVRHQSCLEAVFYLLSPPEQLAFWISLTSLCPGLSYPFKPP
jgi:hypothetical protein